MEIVLVKTDLHSDERFNALANPDIKQRYASAFSDNYIRNSSVFGWLSAMARGRLFISDAFFIENTDEFFKDLLFFIGENKSFVLRSEDSISESNAFVLAYSPDENADGKRLIFSADTHAVKSGLVKSVDKDMVYVYRALRQERQNALMQSGVFIEDDSTYVSWDSKIGEGVYLSSAVRIESGTIVEDEVFVGSGCYLSESKIGRYASLKQGSNLIKSQVGEGANILSSTLLEASVGFESKVGPYAYLRPNSNIGKNVKIGDFVEIKNSVVGDNTKISHLSYVGDADLGSGVNIGCGVVFVNYDGKNKHRTSVGDGAFIGCNVNLVSPVSVGKNAYVAAGSTITDRVEDNQLAIARQRQVNKDGWALKQK